MEHKSNLGPRVRVFSLNPWYDEPLKLTHLAFILKKLTLGFWSIFIIYFLILDWFWVSIIFYYIIKIKSKKSIKISAKFETVKSSRNIQLTWNNRCNVITQLVSMPWTTKSSDELLEFRGKIIVLSWENKIFIFPCTLSLLVNSARTS